MSDNTHGGAAERRATHLEPEHPAEVVPPLTPPPAWYPDPHDPTRHRYWDGGQWTEHVSAPAAVAVHAPDAATAGTRDAAAAAQVAPAVGPAAAETQTVGSVEASPKRPWYRRKRVLIPVGVLGGILVLSGIVNATSGDDDRPAARPPAGLTDDRDTSQLADADEPVAEPVLVAVPNVIGMDGAAARTALETLGLTVDVSGDDTMPVIAQDVAAGVELEEGAVVVLTLEEKPQLTLGQQNAIGSAESYLDYSGFSRAGLFQQLTSEYGEGYEAADAEFALAYLEQNGLVDWNAEAAESAASYLEYSQFSRDGLYQQLTSEYGEEFTPEQAEYALGQVGY